MYKFAQQTKIAEQAKNAEVRGVMAAFVDRGLVKVASQESFEELCDVVSANLDYDYDLQKVAAVTEAVLTGNAPMRKTAAQQKIAHETARNAALGELLLMKTAGQIDDATFVREANALIKVGGLKDILTAKQLRKGLAARREANTNLKAIGGRRAKDTPLGKEYMFDRADATEDVLKGLGKTVGAYGGALAGVGGAGLLGKRLYDKYAE